MATGKTFIEVLAGSARVARYVPVAEGSIVWSYAANADELAADAAQAVQDASIALSVPGHYPCPPELASRATWPVRRLMNVDERYGDSVEATPEDIIELCQENDWPVPTLRERDETDDEGRPIREFVDENGYVVLRDVWSAE
mgnify:CR=1 FL=1